MSSTTEPWFVSERSEALVGLLLTSRDDVRIRDERAQDGEVDFLVELRSDAPHSAHLFVVKVKGALSSDPYDLSGAVAPLAQGLGRAASLPVCLAIANVRDNRAYYAWGAEPLVESMRASLAYHDQPSLRQFDRAALDEIIEKVRSWYQVLPTQLVTTC